MSIESERIALLRRLKKDAKPCIKAQARRLKMSYQTILCLVKGQSLGTIKTWQRIEKYYNKQDRT